MAHPLMTAPAREPGPDRAADGFHLGHALRLLATRDHAFVLRSDQAPGLEVRIRIEPIGPLASPVPAFIPAGSAIARYRRTVSVVDEGDEALGVVAVTRVDVDKRRFIDNDAMGHHAVGEAGEPLPERADIGDTGLWTLARPQPVAGQAGPRREPARIEWALAPWKDGQALWCLHIRPPADVGPVSSECYVVRPDGTIIGAALRITAPAGFQDPATRSSSAGLITLASQT